MLRGSVSFDSWQSCSESVSGTTIECKVIRIGPRDPAIFPLSDRDEEMKLRARRKLSVSRKEI